MVYHLNFIKLWPTIGNLINYENYGKLSGIKLNKSKTEAMWKGRNKYSTYKIADIFWPSKPIKALGLYFGNNPKQTTRLYWSTQIQRCGEHIQKWSKRQLTIYGKIQVIITYILPKFNYLFNSLVVPKSFLNQINSVLYINFFGIINLEKLKG